jgi:Tol biopolymer transport system component
MGQVWKARDGRLGREIAIKVLPESIAADPGFLSRFQGEARAASALNHPNIITIHDIGSDGETPYILMELVDGQTLRKLLEAGPLPLKKTLAIASQVAEGLAAAHARGIVHRDLKPENVMVTRDGVAKILDFGLARPLPTVSGDEKTASSAFHATEPGTILGTVGYMSPEQAAGRPADFRCDQFSLGSVLYEMVTARRAFKRNTPAESLVAIIREDPEPIAQAAPGAPQALAWIIERCLAKDPEERYASTRDLARDLRQVASHLSQPTGVLAAGAQGTGMLGSRGSKGSHAASLVVLALGAALGVAGVLLLRRVPAVEPPVSRYLTYSGHESEPAVSPDGKFVAFTSQRGGKKQIWLKQLADGSEIALTPGPDHTPRFTSDGAAILFSRLEGGMESTYRVPAVGGAARRVIANAGAAEPSPDGREIAFLRPTSRSGAAGFDLVVAAAEGGSERTLHHVEGLIACPPRWSPDGRILAMPYSLTGTLGGNPYRIALVPREKGEIREVVPRGEHGTLSPAVWVDGGRALLYAELDPGYFSTSGRIVRQDVPSGRTADVYRGLSLGEHLDVAGAGRVVYEASTIRANLREMAIGSGEARGWEAQGRWLSRGNSVDRQPFYSPDGERVVFTSNREGNMDIWELTLGNGATRRLMDNPADDWDPYLSRDGKYLLWSSKRSGNYEIWIANADGTQPRQLSKDGVDAENPTVASDGQGGQWVYYGSYAAKNPGVWRMRLDGSEAARVVAGTFRDPAISPDGRHVAFIDVSEANHARLRIARVADGGFDTFVLDVQVNPAAGVAGFRLRFMPDGRSVIFGGFDPGGGSALWIQAFEPGRDTTSTRRRIALFDAAQTVETFAISPDGRRVIVSATERPSDLVLVEGLAGVSK